MFFIAKYYRRSNWISIAVHNEIVDPFKDFFFNGSGLFVGKWQIVSTVQQTVPV